MPTLSMTHVEPYQLCTGVKINIGRIKVVQLRIKAPYFFILSDCYQLLVFKGERKMSHVPLSEFPGVAQACDLVFDQKLHFVAVIVAFGVRLTLANLFRFDRDLGKVQPILAEQDTCALQLSFDANTKMVLYSQGRDAVDIFTINGADVYRNRVLVTKYPPIRPARLLDPPPILCRIWNEERRVSEHL
jgi:hypothetical protein